MSSRTCSSCETPLPTGAAYCPNCGEATPTELSQETGEARSAPALDSAEAEFRPRLQRAIGEGYELRDLIGRGGFGEVYAAWDVELRREVAVKTLRHDLYPTPTLLARFKREARAAARLRHENVIPIYAVGESEGVVFMIMPKIEGESLKVLVQREGKLPVAEARRILLEAARALSVAQRAGIVHRDVKPENILLEGQDRHVYLTDFGIAKALEGEEDGLTGTGMIVGTPNFMSPEQASGDRSVDHRSDLYSLGVVGYELLTGRLPFQATNLHDLIYQQATTTPPEIRSLRPDAPADLADAVMRCIQKQPEARWGSADELARALQGLPTEQRSIRKGWRGWPVRVAAVVVVAAGLTAYLVLHGDRPPLPPNAADTVPPGPALVGADTGVTGAGRLPPVRGAVPREPQRQDLDTAPAPGPRGAAIPPSPPPAASAGYLTVNARPYGMVAINGVDVKLTPLTRHALAPGRYVVTVTRDGYETWVDTVTITAGNEERRAVALIPPR